MSQTYYCFPTEGKAAPPVVAIGCRYVQGTVILVFIGFGFSSWELQKKVVEW